MTIKINPTIMNPASCTLVSRCEQVTSDRIVFMFRGRLEGVQVRRVVLTRWGDYKFKEGETYIVQLIRKAYIPSDLVDRKDKNKTVYDLVAQASRVKKL